MKNFYKNILVISFTLIILILFVGCKKNPQNGELSKESITYLAKVQTVDYNYDFNIDTNKIISNYEELKQYCIKLNSDKRYTGDGKNIIEEPYIPNELKSYDAKYFESKSLALVYIPLSSISDNIEVEKVEKQDNNVDIYYNVISPEIGVAQMGAKLVVVEIDKDISEINISF